MAVIEKTEFFKLAQKPEASLRIVGVQNGNFIAMADIGGTTYICAKKSKHLEFRAVNEILRLLQVDTSHSEAKLEFANWVGT